MTTLLVLSVVALLVAINIFLWKSGFLFDAEKPKVIEDVPVKDPKERRAFVRRLERWRHEGKISREEYEHLKQLAEADWDEVIASP